MKLIIIGIFIFGSISSFACSCEETFHTPYPYEIAKAAVKKLGYDATSSKIVKYFPTILDRLSSIGQEPTGGNCIARLAGKPVHTCTESFRGHIKVTVQESNCYLRVKVVRKKNSYRSKILENTCL